MAQSNIQMTERAYVRRWLRRNARPSVIDELLETATEPLDRRMLEELRAEMLGPRPE